MKTIAAGGLASVCLIALLSSCTQSGSQVAAKASPPTSSSAAGRGPTISVPLELGYGETELFCAQPPTVGAISYQVSGKRASLSLAAGGLPHATTLGVEWLNDSARGYTIASFGTDAAGREVQSSLRMFRPAEKHGVRMILNDRYDHRIARFNRCP